MFVYFLKVYECVVWFFSPMVFIECRTLAVYNMQNANAVVLHLVLTPQHVFTKCS